MASVQPLMTCGGAVTLQRHCVPMPLCSVQQARGGADLVGGEGGGLAALVAAVELGAVDQGSLVVALAGRI